MTDFQNLILEMIADKPAKLDTIITDLNAAHTGQEGLIRKAYIDLRNDNKVFYSDLDGKISLPRYVTV